MIKQFQIPFKVIPLEIILFEMSSDEMAPFQPFDTIKLLQNKIHSNTFKF